MPSVIVVTSCPRKVSMNAPSSMACLSSRVCSVLHVVGTKQHRSRQVFAVCDPASFSRMKSQTLFSEAPSLDLPNFLTLTWQQDQPVIEALTKPGWTTASSWPWEPWWLSAWAASAPFSVRCPWTQKRHGMPSLPQLFVAWQTCESSLHLIYCKHYLSLLVRCWSNMSMPSFWSTRLRHASCSRSTAFSHLSGEWSRLSHPGQHPWQL